MRATLWSLLPIYMVAEGAGDAMVPAPSIYGGEEMRATLWSLLLIYMVTGDAGDAVVPAPNIYGGRGCGRRYGPCSQYIW